MVECFGDHLGSTVGGIKEGGDDPVYADKAQSLRVPFVAHDPGDAAIRPQLLEGLQQAAVGLEGGQGGDHPFGGGQRQGLKKGWVFAIAETYGEALMAKPSYRFRVEIDAHHGHPRSA